MFKSPIYDRIMIRINSLLQRGILSMGMIILKAIYVFDNYVLFLIKKYVQNKYLDAIMRVITTTGNLGSIWVAIAFLLIIRKPYREIGILVLITLIAGTILGEGIIKNIVKRNRPFHRRSYLNLLITKPKSYSFPSGHTLSSFAAAHTLSVYFLQYKFIFIAIAILIALSRVYLYVHYPTDIISGTILGILCSKLVLVIFNEDYISYIINSFQGLF